MYHKEIVSLSGFVLILGRNLKVHYPYDQGAITKLGESGYKDHLVIQRFMCSSIYLFYESAGLGPLSFGA